MTTHSVRHVRIQRTALALCMVGLAWTPAAAQEAEFQALSEQMRQKIISAFDLDPASLVEDAAVLVTRSLVSRSITETVNRSNATIEVLVAESRAFVPPPVELRTETKADATIECSPDQWCNYGCDSPWPWEKAGCEIDKALCKSARKLDCERRKTMAQSISDKKIATISFRNVTVKGRARAAGVSLEIPAALDAVTLRAALGASIQLSVSGHLQPEPLITVFSGCFGHDFEFRDEPVDMGESDFALESKLSIVTEGDKVAVKVEPSKPRVTLRFAGTPALRFIARNPVAFLACSMPYTLAGLSNLTHPNDTAKMDYELPLPAQSQTLGVLTTKAEGWDIEATPRVTTKALGVAVNVSPNGSRITLGAIKM